MSKRKVVRKSNSFWLSKKIWVSVGILFLVGVIIILPKLALLKASFKKTENNKTITYFLDSKKGLSFLAEDLVKKKVVSSSSDLIKIGEYKNLNEQRLASGKYLIEPKTSLKTLLNGFTKNSAGNGNAEVEVEVTFNNCKDIYALATCVSNCISLDRDKLVSEILNRERMSRLTLNTKTISSMFFPNTYNFFYDTDEFQFLDRMEKVYTSFWNDERLKRLKFIGLKSPSQAVTLASVVYMEQSKNSEEWPVIAGLYLNRIRKKMKLQSDPTFKFCWGDQLNGVQRLTYKHREIDCPYNTYKYRGLPPGPIYIPPTSVLEAVLKPVESDYIYMCAKPNYSGTHNFSETYQEHKRFANEFQKWIATQ